MEILNELTDFDQGVTFGVVEKSVATIVTSEKVEVTRASWQDDVISGGEWTWREMRSYIIRQITQAGGTVTHSPAQVAGITKRFIKEWGPERSEAIARHAFGYCDGYWNGEAITITRFCKGSDPYFAAVIVDRLGI